MSTSQVPIWILTTKAQRHKKAETQIRDLGTMVRRIRIPDSDSVFVLNSDS